MIFDFSIVNNTIEPRLIEFDRTELRRLNRQLLSFMIVATLISLLGPNI